MITISTTNKAMEQHNVPFSTSNVQYLQWYQRHCYFSVSISSIQDVTIASLVADWNASLEKNQEIVEAANEELKQQFDNGNISAQAYLKGLRPSPQKVKPPSLTWSRWFLRVWGWSLLSRQSDAQASLPYDSFDMQQARARVASLTKESGVHPALIINYDQLWRASWQFGGKLMWKARSGIGKRMARKKAPKRAEKKLHSVKGARRSVTAARISPANLLIFFKTGPQITQDVLTNMASTCKFQ